MSAKTKDISALYGIPDIDDVRSQTAVGAANNAVELQKWKKAHVDAANDKCNQNIAKAAKNGYFSTGCDTWISDGYIASLQAKGYDTELFDPCDDGACGHLSSLDTMEAAHYIVSWGEKTK